MIIVTGAAGFIGSCLIKELNNLGYTDIFCVDRLGSDDRWKNLNGLKYLEFIYADNLLAEGLLESIGEIDCIFHLGACSDTTQTNADYLLENNTNFSKNLISYALDNQIPIIYASSAATYGDGENGYEDSHDLIPSQRPLNMYGYSKQLVDEWLISYLDSVNSKCIGLKFFNVYGPNEYHKGKMSSVVYHAFNQIKKNGSVNLFKSYHKDFKDGEQTRDFIYVKDVCRAMIYMMENEFENGIYNLGTGTPRTFKDLVKATFKALELEPNINYIDMPEGLKDQYQYYTKASMDKFLNQAKGFNFLSLEEGVKDYVLSHLNNKYQYFN